MTVLEPASCWESWGLKAAVSAAADIGRLASSLVSTVLAAEKTDERKTANTITAANPAKASTIQPHGLCVEVVRVGCALIGSFFFMCALVP